MPDRPAPKGGPYFILTTFSLDEIEGHMSWKKGDSVIGQGHFIATPDAAHDADHRIYLALTYAKGHEEIPMAIDLGLATSFTFLPFGWLAPGGTPMGR